MALMGEDGRGYELAGKLESWGVWRSWLGESNYTSVVHFLASPSTWEAFLKTEDSKTRAQIQLQLRVRALLYDKASVSLYLRSPPSSSSSSSAAASSSSSSTAAAAPSWKINHSYLQLHEDDVYFSLEDDTRNGVVQPPEGSISSNSIQSKIQSKHSLSVGSRYVEPEVDNISDESGHYDLPESWYNQFTKKYRASRLNILALGDQEPHNRTAEGMSTYLRRLEKHKRKRQAYKEDQYVGFGNPVLEKGSNLHSVSASDGNNLLDDETSFFPEIMFPLNCVPDSALPPASRAEDNKKIEFYGVLDCLPPVVTRSPAMMERFGIRPDYLRTGFERSKYRGKNGLEGNKRPLGQEQALQMSHKVIAHVLTGVGFESASQVSMEVLSQLLSCHICKLGHILKALTNNYRKQCSAIEILKMFLQTAGYSNLGALVEHAKDGNRTITHPAPQHLRELQSGFQSQLQSPILQPQQLLRQMHPQMQMQMMHPQNMAFQQQQGDRMQRHQPSTPRSVMSMDKERPMLEVKIENPTDLPMDGNSMVNGRHPQMQFRQQQMGGMANLPAQSRHQFKQLASLQIPQLQTQNMVMVRPPPVKVEGFQELMGGDATLKHDSEEHKLMSPSK
ncbi:uncharacterized protein LOC122660843 isoform X2 [Telopea speciosissima]|uniref:uncharacterized protein LOC122660843 isoform X1 n=1 Tax=Telopea speciosissima TaxID=54955 RepID=UPI001CC45326|nr:uncharacterized protein LOC122660843 isoform X1 [Telopea speciosissima]XP_043712029.1 uncharacterized protein LOC122660843 isoform X1 [Telopea speciosissima]XP_043712030.1 uncharacterized protein LOC122660843 isoform X2 [Telopea speciosissima]